MIPLGQAESVRQIQQTQEGFENVRQPFVLWDTIRIGANVNTAVQGWYTNFTNLMAAGNTHSFFDTRNEAEARLVSTNMKTKGQLAWPFIITDLGIGFYYPDPINAPLFDGDRAASKIFQETAMSETTMELFVGGADYKILSLVPEMAPYGFGPSGNLIGGTGLASPSTLMSNGLPTGGNRFWFTDQAIPMPQGMTININWNLEKVMREVLEMLIAPQPIAFQAGTYANEVKIRIAIRGLRDVQQLGNLRK
jgi:hypothetical protein